MSNSIILKDILTSESSELTNSINSFMENKINEFTTIMKTNIEKAISEKIDKFYKNANSQHDKILFNIDGKTVIEQVRQKLKSQISNFTILQLSYINTDTTYNTMCFMMSRQHYTGNGNDTCTLHIFKTFIIEHSCGAREDPRWLIYKHNMSNDMLFTIKNFQTSSCAGGLTSGLKLYNDHPEYFKSQCCEFETICNKEYSEISKQKQELQKLIDEHIENQEYYSRLEDEIAEIKRETEKLQKEKENIKEEKKKLILVKEKMVIMRMEIEKEKDQLEIEKNKLKLDNLDLDEYLEESNF